MESFGRWNGDHWFWRRAIGLVLGVLGAWPVFGAIPEWVCATDEAWDRWPRYSQACVVFQDKLWSLGGYVNYCSDESPDSPWCIREAWYSSDGEHWTQAYEPSWAGRFGHSALVFKDKMWVLGGEGCNAYFNDVWYTEDGETWTNATYHAAWSTRSEHASVVFQDKMWILGGGTGEVWSSEDGINWVLETDAAPWGSRDSFPAVVFKDKIWLLGGPCRDSKYYVWCSENGKDWMGVTSNAPWAPRYEHSAVVCQDKIWIIGGSNGRNDMWYSRDGVEWVLVDCKRKVYEKSARLEFNNQIWTLGGYKGDCDFYGDAYSEVWYLGPGVNSTFSASPVSGISPLTVQCTDQSLAYSTTINDWTWDFGDGTGSNEQNPSHIYTQRGLYTVSLTVGSADDADTSVKEGYIRVAGEQHPFHSADADRNGRISLSELLRVIQFYNYGAFHCAAGTEDGYAPGPGGMECGLYDGDYAPPDGQMNLSEVLRVIQFFNVGGYRACVDGEDGFCPGREDG